MTIWDWVLEWVDRAEERQDEEGLRLWELFEQGWDLMHTDPDRSLAVFAEGRQLAGQLGEPRWVLLYDQWRLQVLLHGKSDYNQAMELAVQATVQSARPQFHDLPQRICLHESLIAVYLGRDPLGYATLIEQALSYMERETPETQDCRLCFFACRIELELARGRPETAREIALVDLAEAEPRGDYQAAGAYDKLCACAFALNDFEELQEWAVAGEERARREKRHPLIAVFLMWQALVARRHRDEAVAQRLCRTAVRQMRRLGRVPPRAFYDAWTRYHEVGGGLVWALRIRDEQLQHLTGKGGLAAELHCRLERCRLRVVLGQPLTEEVEAARTVAGELRDPAPMLDKLAQLERSARAGAD